MLAFPHNSHIAGRRHLDSRELVDISNGIVDRRIFADREIYEAELELVFGRCWLFLCHESDIPNPGDFFTTTMAEDPVIAIRDSSGKINAFINSCRHRGMKVCRADRGNAASFTCAYHGWTYGNDGKLIGVPNFQDAYFEQLDMEQWGLVPVAQVDSYKGLIFATFDPKAPSLVDYLGDMAYYFDIMLDRQPGGTEAIFGQHKWIMPCNWKFAADNFQGDGYHVGTSHLSAIRIGFGGSSNRDQSQNFTVYAGNGHGWGCSVNPVDETSTPELNNIDRLLPAMEKQLGPDRAGKVWPIHGTIFPNLSLLTTSRTIRVWHPRGPDKIEVWSWCLVDKASDPDVKEATRVNYLRRFSPSGSFEQDDGENWQYCTINSGGGQASKYPFNFQMGLGHERRDETFPGRLCHSPSESNQRGFYTYWARLMEGKPWEQTLDKRTYA